MPDFAKHYREVAAKHEMRDSVAVHVCGVDITWSRLRELLEMAEFADSKPEYRLAVVDPEDTTEINVWNESMTVLTPATFYRVVKMEGE